VRGEQSLGHGTHPSHRQCNPDCSIRLAEQPPTYERERHNAVHGTRMTHTDPSMPACIEAMKARSTAAGCTRLIADGIALLGRTSQVTPKLTEVCHDKYLEPGHEISTQIPTSAREQARHLKRDKTLGSLHEVYLEALLISLVERGFMTSGLEAADPAAAPVVQHRRAA